MEKTRNPNPPSFVPDMNAPTGIDLHPSPPSVARVSKRAGVIALCIVCSVGGLLGFGVYRRQGGYRQTVFSADKEKNIAPATTAAAAITKDIPTGVVNLATDRDKTKSETSDDQVSIPQDASGGVPARSAVNQQPYVQYQALQREPTPEERRLADAYERELRAIAAPTGIQSSNNGSFSQVPNPVNPSDASPLAALAQILSPRSGVGNQQLTTATANSGVDDQNLQLRKEAFLTRSRALSSDDYLKSVRVSSLSPYEIKAGWEIPAVMEQALNSDLPGDLKALVTANVYDTGTGRYLLVPQGARLIGTYDSSVAYGQNGLQAVWNRIIFPDASSIDLGGMVGQDSHGASGFRQDVDNHYKRLVGLSVLSSLFSAGFQLSQSKRGSILQYPSPAEIAAGSVGQEVSQVGAQITRKNLNIQPTIKIPVGYKFNVRVNRDILFDSPYEPLQSPSRALLRRDSAKK